MARMERREDRKPPLCPAASGSKSGLKFSDRAHGPRTTPKSPSSRASAFVMLLSCGARRLLRVLWACDEFVCDAIEPVGSSAATEQPGFTLPLPGAAVTHAIDVSVTTIFPVLTEVALPPLPPFLLKFLHTRPSNVIVICLVHSDLQTRHAVPFADPGEQRLSHCLSHVGGSENRPLVGPIHAKLNAERGLAPRGFTDGRVRACLLVSDKAELHEG